MLAGLALFTVLRIGSAIHGPRFLQDSPSYLKLSFLGHEPRLWTVPLLFNLLGGDQAREAFQVVLGTAAWQVLALTLTRSVGNRQIGLVAGAVVLLLGLAPMVTVWDADMLSESITISLTVLMVAGCLELGRRQEVGLLVGMVVLVCLWVFARQENVYVFLVLLPFAMVLAVWRLPRRAGAAVSVALLLVGGWAGYDVEVGQQHAPANFVMLYNAAELTLDRHSMAVFFERRGEPVAAVAAAARMRVPGPLQGAAVAALVDDAAFRAWVRTRFQGAFVSYAMQRPGQVFLVPLGRLFANVSRAPYHFEGSPRRIVPGFVTGLVWSDGDDLDLWVGLALAAALAGACAALRVRVRHVAVLGALVIATVVMTLLSYDLATEDYGRLFAPDGLCLRLLLLLTIALAADALIVRWPSRVSARRVTSRPMQRA